MPCPSSFDFPGKLFPNFASRCLELPPSLPQNPENCTSCGIAGSWTSIDQKVANCWKVEAGQTNMTNNKYQQRSVGTLPKEKITSNWCSHYLSPRWQGGQCVDMDSWGEKRPELQTCKNKALFAVFEYAFIYVRAFYSCACLHWCLYFTLLYYILLYSFHGFLYPLIFYLCTKLDSLHPCILQTGTPDPTTTAGIGH